jgi:hypothetical protein
MAVGVGRCRALVGGGGIGARSVRQRGERWDNVGQERAAGAGAGMLGRPALRFRGRFGLADLRGVGEHRHGHRRNRLVWARRVGRVGA